MQKVTIGQYLLDRLKEVGVDTIFGVPGDYSMPLLDMIDDDPELTWGNNANELNAAYAADGYARIKGVGCLLTTFGVGELSAINGIAGSYAEMLPVIHIVGTPKTKFQARGAIVHHSLGNSDYQVFTDIFSRLCVAATYLAIDNNMNVIKQIDNVIEQAFRHKKPGYIGIPIDLMSYEIEVPKTKVPLNLSVPKTPAKIQAVALRTVLDTINKSKHPVIIVDACVQRFRLEKEAVEFVKKSGFPTYEAPMGKGIIPEDLENYRGCYVGEVSLDGISKELKQADLIIELGPIKTDCNTGGFTLHYDKDKTTSLRPFTTTVFYADYDKVSMAEFLPLLTKSLPSKPRVFDLGPRHYPDPIVEGTEITHNYFWNKIPEYIAPDSILIAESGTSEFASFNMKTPKGCTHITQVLWSSIGYSVGAAVGAAAAARDRQVYLFCGDGSFQLTAQEVSVMLRQGLTPVIFILNNDGYLIEKVINGPHRRYNNFQMWEYSKTLDYFGCNIQRNLEDEGQSPVGVKAKVSTREEFEAAMEKVTAEPKKIHFLELIMPQFDAPSELLRQVEIFKRG